MIKKQVNLIVTGSSQAKKALDIYNLLIEHYDVNVIMSKNAHHFVDFGANVKTYSDLYPNGQYEVGDENESILFRTNVALNIVYPATANYISQIANGLSNDLVTTLFSFNNAHVPTMIFPAFHVRFAKNPFYLRNKKIISETNSKVKIFDTLYGVFPDGEEGEGKIYDPKDAFEEIQHFISKLD